MVAHRWPAGTVFRRLVLDPADDERPCGACARPMSICDHRHRRVFTLAGPLQVTCKLLHCADRRCPGAKRTVSPRAELDVAPPRWLVDWEVFAWLGHGRFDRRRSVAQLRAELAADHGIELSDDAVEYYAARYVALLAAGHADLAPLREAYRDVPALALTLDAVQPERGRPALCVVRELRARRVWFAAPVAPGAPGEVERVVARARDLAAALGRPVAAWTTSRQDALAAVVAALFPDVPRRVAEPPVPRARAVSWRPPAPSHPPAPPPPHSTWRPPSPSRPPPASWRPPASVHPPSWHPLPSTRPTLPAGPLP